MRLALAVAPDGTARVVVDRAARLPGRGAYLCDTPACLDAALRRGGVSVARALRCTRAAVEQGADALRQVPDGQVPQAQAAAGEGDGSAVGVEDATVRRQGEAA